MNQKSVYDVHVHIESILDYAVPAKKSWEPFLALI